MNTTPLLRLALGDFRDRVRRPVYAVMLLAAVGLALLAVPADGSRWTVMDVAGYRGRYNSAYVGTVTALAGALWLTVGGFFAVRSTVARDEQTGVGRLLAATRLRTSGYLAAKFLSNLLVLWSMTAVLLLTAVILQLTRGEDRHLDAAELLLPFAVLTLPLTAVTAAAALLFEATPVLRGGLGNLVWFVCSLAAVLGGQSAAAPFGGIGTASAAASMREALQAQRVRFSDAEFSLGLTYVDDGLRTFRWDGFVPSGDFVLGRMVLVLVAVLVALLPVLWFGRFGRSRAAEPRGGGSRRSVPLPLPSRPRLVVAEVRVLLQGVSGWWWLVAAGIAVAGAVVPVSTGVMVVLPMAWVWPVLLWSRLGTRAVEFGVDGLLAATVGRSRLVVAGWLAGVLLGAVTGGTVVVRQLAAGDWAGAACWVGGVLFVPAAAVALGTVARSHRPFQALYPPVWYLIVNQVGAVDFMGAVREDGVPAGLPAVVVVAAAAGLLGIAVVVDRVRERTRG